MCSWASHEIFWRCRLLFELVGGGVRLGGVVGGFLRVIGWVRTALTV